MGVGGQGDAPAALPPRNTRCMMNKSWLGHRVGLDEYGESNPLPRFDPLIVHPVASRYTD